MNLVSELLVSLATVVAPGAFVVAPAAPPVDIGRVEVIAQGAVPFTGTAVQWTVANETASAGDAPVAATGSDPTFIVTVDGALVLADDTRPAARLGAGEAGYVPPGSPLTMSAVGADDDASIVRITLSTAGGLGTAFATVPGPHDVEIRRAVLDAGAAIDLPAGDAPTLVIGLSGAVNVTTPSVTQVVGALAATVIDGPLKIVAADEPAPVVVLIGVVGPLVTTEDAAPSSTPPSSTPPPTPTPGSPTSGGAPPDVTAPPTTTVPPTTVPSTLDSDDDGLTDADESARGTNPSRPDSDDDGLSDGNEVNDYDTDPLALDTDGDGVTDGDEVSGTYGAISPTNKDTDYDGLSDGDELFLHHTNPVNSDTDVDGDSDGVEIAAGHDPLVLNDRDGDLLGDGLELFFHTNPDNPDSDEDQLTDTYELFTTFTDPNRFDTDGDGTGDAVENASGTDPNDPASHP